MTAEKEVQWNDVVYRIGDDKVLQLVNNPELECI